MKIKNILILLSLIIYSKAVLRKISTEYETISEKPDITIDGIKIEGEIFRPKDSSANKKYPGIILVHGFGGSYKTQPYQYAQFYAKYGFVSYVITIPQVARNSVIYEANRINQIIDEFKKLNYVNTTQLFLYGESQGGFDVSNVASCRNDIKNLILFYPAYVIHDDCLKRHSESGQYEPILDPDDFPFNMTELEKMDFPAEETIGFNNVKHPYTRDALSFNIYERIKNYKNNVLIVHGDKDTVVPLNYSRRAIDPVEGFPEAELKIIEGAGHGFYYGESVELSKQYSLEFLLNNSEIDNEDYSTDQSNQNICKISLLILILNILLF